MRRFEQDAVQRFGGWLAVITGDGTGTRGWRGSSAEPANRIVASKFPSLL